MGTELGQRVHEAGGGEKASTSGKEDSAGPSNPHHANFTTFPPQAGSKRRPSITKTGTGGRSANLPANLRGLAHGILRLCAQNGRSTHPRTGLFPITMRAELVRQAGTGPLASLIRRCLNRLCVLLRVQVEPMAEPDELYTLRQEFWVGNFHVGRRCSAVNDAAPVFTLLLIMQCRCRIA